jgi:hypothetical protein
MQAWLQAHRMAESELIVNDDGVQQSPHWDFYRSEQTREEPYRKVNNSSEPQYVYTLQSYLLFQKHSLKGRTETSVSMLMWNRMKTKACDEIMH